MTGFEKIEKALHNARLQYTDTKYTVSVTSVDRYTSIGYESIACAVYANHPKERIVFVYIAKWNTDATYQIKVTDGKGECKHKMNTSGDVITAVTMLIRNATL